jgi:DNA repair protein RecN (Recombination protein N)
MLRHLRVTNFAILSDVELELGAGLNVLTGETGAGKSLIVEAVNLLRGGRASADIPRAGADEAVVEAVVEVPDDLRAEVAARLDAAGLPAMDGGELMIRRVIARATTTAGGRSRTYINGALTTAAVLAEIGALLVDLSGQHQHQGLVDPGRHLELVDGFGAIDRATMDAAWAELQAADAAIAELGGDERDRAARVEFLRYQLDELDAAALRPGEDAAIDAERARLASVDVLVGAARRGEALLYADDGSARDRVAAAAREVERARRVDATLDEVARALTEVEQLIDDVADRLRGYADKLEEAVPDLAARLGQLDDRIAVLHRLSRKHGGADAAALVARAGELRGELDALVGREAALAQRMAARAAAERAATAAAATLTEKRGKSARQLERKVGAALAELGMAAAVLEVVVEPRALGPRGADRVELMLASNKGEDRRPLVKVASGGELSRIMLALKLGLDVSRRVDAVATYVFDEVDAGIGGATAQVVGSQIRRVADHRQVLCVTHLPQIAAYADCHFHVEKQEVAGRTETRVTRLGATARQEELARMLGGAATTKARAHAAELLQAAGQKGGKAKRARAQA